jgi:adenosylcobyric acid synthase
VHEDGRTDADYIKAYIVNKFRGDMNILRPGLRMIEEKTAKPVIGTLYYQGNLGLDEEDGLSLEKLTRFSAEGHAGMKIVVLRLKYISNFTDFAPFLIEPDVEIKYSLWEEDINSADLIIIPGSKNTVSDLLLLRESGVEDCVKAAVKKGTPLVGICGGYQMLGRKILDPHNVESSHSEIEGIGLLDIETTLDKTKTTCQLSANLVDQKWFGAVQGTSTCKWNQLKGYEIHMGHTTGDVGLFNIKRLNGSNDYVPDGSVKGNVWGTYIHGIFDNDGLRASVINSLRIKKGLGPREETISYHSKKEEAIERWADILGKSVDICFILREVGMEYCMANLPEDLK